jgi:hypothetical protein
MEGHVRQELTIWYSVTHLSHSEFSHRNLASGHLCTVMFWKVSISFLFEMWNTFTH